jgi:putative transposase
VRNAPACDIAPMDFDLRNRAAYFFTLSLEEEFHGALTEQIDTLRLAFKAGRDRYPFTMLGGVVLPDHLHCILSLSSADSSREKRWQFIKSIFERVVGRGRSVWTPECEERRIETDAQAEREVDAIHADPVRHGLARLPARWPYSSFHAYVAQGLRPIYWCPEADQPDALRFGRRAA